MSAETKEQAQLDLLWRMWHRDPMTQQFFATLKKRAEHWAFRAATQAGRTKGMMGSAEHNNLIRTNELLKVIEEYGSEQHVPADIYK